MSIDLLSRGILALRFTTSIVYASKRFTIFVHLPDSPRNGFRRQSSQHSNDALTTLHALRLRHLLDSGERSRREAHVALEESFCKDSVRRSTDTHVLERGFAL